MLIVGAKGFAKEVLQVCHDNNGLENLAFFDDINYDIGDKLYNEFPILKSLDQVKEYFENTTNNFTIGIGGPQLRRMLFEKFTKIGGNYVSTVAKSAIIGTYDNIILPGTNIMQKAVLTNSLRIGKGVIINQLSSIGHDVTICDFVEVCPNVSISGNCVIGENTFIGTGAIILPKITIGKNVIVAAGAVITNNIPDNCLVAGIPAVIKKTLQH